jgi:hypothetical protein
LKEGFLARLTVFFTEGFLPLSCFVALAPLPTIASRLFFSVLNASSAFAVSKWKFHLPL